MATEKMSPVLKTLVERLAGAYPSNPQNETLPKFLENLPTEELGELFRHTFWSYRQAVEAEHELILTIRPYGTKINLSPETSQLGDIADALLTRTVAAGIKMTFAVKASAVDSCVYRWPFSEGAIRSYAGESNGYYRFHTNQAWHDKSAIHPYILGSSGMICFNSNSHLVTTFDVRDVYLTEAKD